METRSSDGPAQPLFLTRLLAWSDDWVQPWRAVQPTAYLLLGTVMTAAMTWIVLGYWLGPVAIFLQTSIVLAPVALLAVIAFVAGEQRFTQFLSWALLAFILLCGGAFCVGLGWAPGARKSLPWELGLGALLAGCVVPIAILPGFRRLCFGAEDGTGWTHIRLIAFATAVSLTLMMLWPLVCLGMTPFEWAVADPRDRQKFLQGIANGSASPILANLSTLGWVLVVTPLLVGYGIRRNARQTIARLGLRPVTKRQWLAVLLLIPGLLAASEVLSLGVDFLWQRLGWRTTDRALLDMAVQLGPWPWGALLAAVTAGVTEEIVLRGVLQPRIGILFSNLFFTSLHAIQYSWDGLLSVFFVGMVMAVIRKKTSTSVSTLVHTGYDLVLMLA